MLVNCSICLGDINLFDKKVSILNCGHFFHANCLNDWFRQQMNCPECRSIVTRGEFARNIFPKYTQETLNKLQSLKDKLGDLKRENFFLKNENFFLQIENSSLKQS